MLVTERAEGTELALATPPAAFSRDHRCTGRRNVPRAGVSRKKCPNENGPGSECLRGRCNSKEMNRHLSRRPAACALRHLAAPNRSNEETTELRDAVGVAAIQIVFFGLPA